MVYDGERHASVASHPQLAERAFVVSSFGKTYHVTGWKVGYVAAPAALSAEFRKVHQYNVFTVNTPMQHGLAAYMADPAPYLGLSDFYQRKRDLFRAGLAQTRLRLLPADGTYFQCVDYGAVSDLPEAQFAQWLTTEIEGGGDSRVGVLYEPQGIGDRALLLCEGGRDPAAGARSTRGPLGSHSRKRKSSHLVPGRDRPRDIFQGLVVIVRIDHDDDPIPAARRKPQEGIETPVPSRIPETGRAVVGAHDEQAQPLRANLPAHHLFCHLLGNQGVRAPCERVLQSDGEARQVGGSGPQAGSCQFR